KLVESWTRRQQQAAMRHSDGLVVEAIRPQLREVWNKRALDQLAVQSGDAVNRVAANDGEMRHANALEAVAFFDQRDAALLAEIAREAHGDLVQQVCIDRISVSAGDN